MNRHLTYAIGPETLLALFGTLLFWFCARHNSGEGRDVALMEKLIWLLPFLTTSIAFTTVFVPGARTWWWLGRAIVATFVVTLLCGGRLIAGLGSGARGQDAAFIIILMFASATVALGTALSGALILAETRPGFATWYQAHKILGTVLTLIAAVPIGFLLGVTVTFSSAILIGIYVEFFKR